VADEPDELGELLELEEVVELVVDSLLDDPLPELSELLLPLSDDELAAAVRDDDPRLSVL